MFLYVSIRKRFKRMRNKEIVLIKERKEGERERNEDDETRKDESTRIRTKKLIHVSHLSSYAALLGNIAALFLNHIWNLSSNIFPYLTAIE